MCLTDSNDPSYCYGQELNQESFDRETKNLQEPNKNLSCHLEVEKGTGPSHVFKSRFSVAVACLTMDDAADTYKLWRIRKTIMQVSIVLSISVEC